MIRLDFHDKQEFYPIISYEGNLLEVIYPIKVSYFRGNSQKFNYSSVKQRSVNEWIGERNWCRNGL